MEQPKTYVRTDAHGAMRVANSDISVDSVVIAWLQGESADEIQRNYPSLTLEETYGAIAYYLGHRAEVDAYLERQQGLWDRLRNENEHGNDALIQRLRALKRDRARKVS
jgi:uncharacterized protein (DUF433 family)